MTARQGAWALRSAVVAAMAAGLLAVVAQPAYADHDVRIGNIGNIELRAGGGNQTVTLRVENRGNNNHNSVDGVAQNVTLTMTVPGGIGAFIASNPGECSRQANDTRLDCTIPQIGPNQAFTGVVQIGAHGNAPIEAGENRNEAAQVTLTSHGGSSTQFNVRVNGPDRAPSVSEVSGTVTDQSTGASIEGARVILADSQSQTFERTTDAQGQFRFADEEIAAGALVLRASRDGYQSAGDVTPNASPNESLTGLQLVLINSASPTPSASASPPPATSTPSASPSPEPATVPASSGRSFFTTLMIVLGVLLLALGIGAIVLMVIRNRRRAQEEEDDGGLGGSDDPTSGPRGPGPTPGSRGVYRPTPTQVAGAGGQTQVLGPGGAVPAVGPRPALANAQTMLQRGGSPAAETTVLPRAVDGAPGTRPPAPGGTRPPAPGGGHTAPMPAAGHTAPMPPAGHTAPMPRPAAPQPGTYGGAAAPGPAPTSPYEGQRGGYGGDPARGGYEGQRGGEYGGGGYAGSPGGYGSPAAPGSGGGTYGGAEPSYRSYDEPTGRHERPSPGPAAGGYGAERGGAERGGGYETDRGYQDGSYRADSYGPDPYTSQRPASGGYADPGYQQQGYQGGYADEAGYDRRGYDGGGGHDHQRGYDERGYPQQPAPASGYPQQPAPASGYPQQPAPASGSGYPADQGYQQGRDPGYDQSYGQAPEQDADYYDESGNRSRHSDPPAERRRLDWLD